MSACAWVSVFEGEAAGEAAADDTVTEAGRTAAPPAAAPPVPAIPTVIDNGTDEADMETEPTRVCECVCVCE